ncbi:MAG: YgiQ family radical SAM protein [Lentisphaeria bacterium]|nr:YgiQ family radical SAM protein [Lentisphaeria bacterium]
MNLTEFLPMTKEEMQARKWDAIDILLVTGDAYVDHPSFGAAVIGRLLEHNGFRVGVIAQPDWKNPDSLKLFGRPKIACAVTSGNMDSMVCIYTAGRRLRHEDMYSPSGKTGMRPPHAEAVYVQLCKAAFPGIPTVLGGVGASMRRLAHYDYWQDKMRPSILVDSKADILVYGMGEKAVTEIFDRLRDGKDLIGIRGTARYAGGKETQAFVPGENDVVLPSFEEFCNDKNAIMRQTVTVEKEMNPWCGKRLIQMVNGRMIVVEPPQLPLKSEEFDQVAEFPYVGKPHFKYTEKIPAFETIQNSIPAVRGCPGGCAFCGLVFHQGKNVISRTEESVLRSIKKLQNQKFFRGTVTDIGGAAGNIFGHKPKNPELCKKCRRCSCMFPDPCPNYNADEKPLLDLLRKAMALPCVKNLFINSGIRLDLALMQPKLTKEIILKHVSGHVKVAPEHLDARVLRLMRKGKADEFPRFREIFEKVSAEAGKEQFLIPLFISNFPGCTAEEMKVVDDYLEKHHWSPQQVQDYIPLPMTIGAAMYYAGTDTDGNPIEVNRGLKERREQRNMLRRKRSGFTPGAYNKDKNGETRYFPPRKDGKTFEKSGKRFEKRKK